MTPRRTLRFWMLYLAAHAFVACLQTAHANQGTPPSNPLKEDAEDFVFMDKCHDGRMYRLTAYQKWVNGIRLPFYDYDGPAGQGTVKTQVAPRVMAARVCRDLAEISDDPNLD